MRPINAVNDGGAPGPGSPIAAPTRRQKSRAEPIKDSSLNDTQAGATPGPDRSGVGGDKRDGRRPVSEAVDAAAIQNPHSVPFLIH